MKKGNNETLPPFSSTEYELSPAAEPLDEGNQAAATLLAIMAAPEPITCSADDATPEIASDETVDAMAWACDLLEEWEAVEALEQVMADMDSNGWC